MIIHELPVVLTFLDLLFTLMGGKLKSLSAASVHCVYKIWLNVKLIGSLTVFSPFPQLMDKESFYLNSCFSH